MRTISLACVIVVAMATLAGCSGKDAEPTPTGTGTAGPSGTGSGPVPTGTGALPSGSARPSGTPGPSGTGGAELPVTATLVPSKTTVAAPANITFNADADGPGKAQATWSLDFGDGSEARTGAAGSLPIGLSHVYTKDGNVSARLTVTFPDTRQATAYANLTILKAVAAGGNRYELNGQMPVFAPATAQDPVNQAGHCAVILAAKKQAQNKTFAEYYDVKVPAGSKALYIEGGASAPVAGSAPVPDFDVVITNDGATVCEVGGSGGIYEKLTLKTPAAGDYVVGIIYWGGPPNQAYTGYIEVR